MKRRNFIRNTAVAGIAISATPGILARSATSRRFEGYLNEIASMTGSDKWPAWMTGLGLGPASASAAFLEVQKERSGSGHDIAKQRSALYSFRDEKVIFSPLKVVDAHGKLMDRVVSFLSETEEGKLVEVITLPGIQVEALAVMIRSLQRQYPEMLPAELGALCLPAFSNTGRKNLTPFDFPTKSGKMKMITKVETDRLYTAVSLTAGSLEKELIVEHQCFGNQVIT